MCHICFRRDHFLNVNRSTSLNLLTSMPIDFFSVFFPVVVVSSLLFSASNCLHRFVNQMNSMFHAQVITLYYTELRVPLCKAAFCFFWQQQKFTKMFSRTRLFIYWCGSYNDNIFFNTFFLLFSWLLHIQFNWAVWLCKQLCQMRSIRHKLRIN